MCNAEKGKLPEKTLFVSVSKGIVISDLKLCPNVPPPVPEQCLLAFSASSQFYLRFNSESQAILVCSTSKHRHWQLLPQKHGETTRRNLPFSESNSSRLILVVQQELFAKDPDSWWQECQSVVDTKTLQREQLVTHYN